MLELNLRIDSVGYSMKPTKEETAKIHKRISSLKSKNISFNDFCSRVGSEGHSFCVFDFSGVRKKENFKSQQIFALDFDGGVSFHEILIRAESYGLPIALAYETFSSNCGNRFRIVFVSEFIVTDIRVSEIITDALMTIFYECDKACRDVSRMFYGGKSIIFSSEKTISLKTLMMELPRFLKDTYGETHYKKHVENFTAKHHLKRCGGFAYITNKESENSISFIENNEECFLNFKETNISSNRKAKREKVRHFSFDALDEKCRLFHEFQTDKRWLEHNELFGIACNMNLIDGGKRRFLEIIEGSCHESYRKKDWKYYFNYMTAEEYQPMECNKFCPYAQNCNLAQNMILTAKVNRNKVVKLKEKEYCTLEEATEDLEEKMLEAINSTANRINIIKAQTANSPLKIAQTLYNKLYSRMDRAKNKFPDELIDKDMTEDDFIEWSNLFSLAREEFKDGKISGEEFIRKIWRD